MENKESEEKPVQKTEEVVTSYEVVQVPTNHELAIRTPEGDLMDLMSAVVMLLNKVTNVEKAVAWLE